MKHPRLAFAAIVAAGALTAFTVASLWNSGPSYGAKSAAQWLKVYRTASLAEREDARRDDGENAERTNRFEKTEAFFTAAAVL